jgi:uncharacterized delta-60 repeat protein
MKLRNWFREIIQADTRGKNAKHIPRFPLRVEGLEHRLAPAAGMLDPTFGIGGKVMPPDFSGSDHIGSGSGSGGSAIALQADKIVVGGYTFDGVSAPDFVVARYNADGSLDATFGANGRVTIDFGGYEFGFAVAVQDDKIVVVGSFNQTVASYLGDFAVARLNYDGTLDSAFGSNGKMIIDFGSPNDTAFGVVVQGDKIVVVGSSNFLDATSDFAVARLNDDGTLDSAFGGDGRVTIDFGSTDRGFDVAVSGGKIIVVGSSGSDFGVARLNDDGTLDNTFSGDGRVTVDFSSFDDAAVSVAVLGDKIIVAGPSMQYSTYLDFGVARLNGDGTLDSTFSDDGRATIDFNSITNFGDVATSVAVQSDSKIIVAGYSEQSTDGMEAAIARFNGDGTLDNTFNGDGSIVTSFTDGSGFSQGDTSVVVQPDGKIVVAGSIWGGFAIARYEGDPPDTDGDGIANSVDLQPSTLSSDFSDGTISGSIVSRGDQLLAVADATDSEDGVIITASAVGGSTPAVISIDGGAALLYVNAGDQLIVTHGSVIVHVLAGTVEATFVGDNGEVATASLNSGNELTFKPESFVFSAPATNTEAVQVLVNGSEIDVGSGEAVRSVQIDITPGNASNTLNLASNGVISVAILSTAGFDARTVNVASLLFAGAHATQSSLKDVNGDGIRDLVVNFRTQDTTLRSLYEHLVADDINEDGVLDSNHEMARVSLTGLCQDGTALIGADVLDLFISGKALRDMLVALAAAGVI